MLAESGVALLANCVDTRACDLPKASATLDGALATICSPDCAVCVTAAARSLRNAVLSLLACVAARSVKDSRFCSAWTPVAAEAASEYSLL